MRGIEAVLANKKRSPVTSIRPSSLAVSNFSECLDFYRRGLGLMLRKQVGNVAEFDVSGSTFTVRGGGGRTTEHLVVNTKDFARLEDNVKTWGTSFTAGPEERDYEGAKARVGSLADPAGNELEIVQYL